MLKRSYKITHRDKLFDLSKVNNWKPTKDVFQLNPCPYCDKIPKAFLESRFVRNEDKDKYILLFEEQIPDYKDIIKKFEENKNKIFDYIMSYDLN